MRDWFLKLWYSINYRFCMVEAYLAANRGDMLAAGEFESMASMWQREYYMCGRKLL